LGKWAAAENRRRRGPPRERERGAPRTEGDAGVRHGGGEAQLDPSDPNGQSLFGALQEKLGLKLEARNSAVDILVVDAAEKVPREN